jgi:pyruvate/2-oxoglutarate dehydrogenase complex dihydrolipoamide dehydrogenase (E3) component
VTEAFDAIIIGAGQAGPSLAGRLTGAGMRVAIVEREHVGGTCVNTGCKPTKTMVASAYAAHLARRGADFGVHTGPVSIDMARVAERAGEIIHSSRKGNEDWLAAMKGLTLIRGHARFTGSDTLKVGERVLQAPRIFINVGGRPAIPDMPGIQDVPYLTNADMVVMDTLPEHLIVVGGSYIGLEFAQMLRRFGSQVTVVEMGERLIAREDPDISDAIRAILEGEGIAIRTGARCITLAREGDGVSVGVDCGQGAPRIHGSHVLLATGRRPNTDDLGLEMAGIATDRRDYILVNDRLETNVPGIWALGDCNGRGAFTHTAYNDFEIVAANLLDGQDRSLAQRVPGYALFVDPPLGRVGLTETQARATGKRVLVSKRKMTRVGRAVEKAETLGFMQMVVDADTRQILGAAILGTGGDEAIHGVLDLMSAGATCDDLRWAVPIHPTVSELWPTVVLDLK